MRVRPRRTRPSKGLLHFARSASTTEIHASGSARRENRRSIRDFRGYPGYRFRSYTRSRDTETRTSLFAAVGDRSRLPRAKSTSARTRAKSRVGRGKGDSRGPTSSRAGRETGRRRDGVILTPRGKRREREGARRAPGRIPTSPRDGEIESRALNCPTISSSD